MSNQTITFMMDKNGDRHDIDLNENVLATDVFEPEDKVVTDTVVKEGFDQFYQDTISNTSDLYNLTTKAPTGRAIATFVTNQLTGEMGGFLGNKTCAQINTWDVEDLTKGDSVICTDGGSITLGGLTVLAGAELVFTAEDVWVEKLTTYVRPENYATSLRGGTIVSSSTSGDVTVDPDTGIGSVSGFSSKANNSRGGLVTLAHKASIGTSILSTDEDIFEVCAIPTTASGGSVPYLYTWTKIWTWIAGKISSVLGLTASDYDGNANTATTATSSNYVNDYAWTSSSTSNKAMQIGWVGDSVSECSTDVSSVSSTASHLLCCYIKDGSTVKIKDVECADTKVGDSDKVDGYHIDVVTSGTISTASDHITFLRYS